MYSPLLDLYPKADPKHGLLTNRADSTDRLDHLLMAVLRWC